MLFEGTQSGTSMNGWLQRGAKDESQRSAIAEGNGNQIERNRARSAEHLLEWARWI